MQDRQPETADREPNLLTRDDTFFGVCQGLGEDLGISPNWFRLAFSLAVFFSPLGAVLGYAAAGVLVFASRLLIPDRRAAAKVQAAAAAAPRAGQNDSEELAVAA